MNGDKMGINKINHKRSNIKFIKEEEAILNKKTNKEDSKKAKILYLKKTNTFLDQNITTSNRSRSTWKSALIKFGRCINWRIDFSENDMIKGFSSIEFQNLSEKTQKSYRTRIYSFAKWLGKNIAIPKYIVGKKREVEDSESFLKFFQNVRNVFEEHSKVKGKFGYHRPLISYGEFSKWDLDFNKSRVLSWIDSKSFKKLKMLTRQTYLYRLKNFLTWTGRDSQYLEVFIERDKTDVNIRKFIERLCILSEEKMITQKGLLQAVNIYLKEKGFKAITKAKLTNYLHRLGVTTNQSGRSKGLRIYFGINLSIKGEKKYGNPILAGRKEKLKRIKQTDQGLTTKKACILMVYDPITQLLKRFIYIKEIKENTDILHELIKGVCKRMALLCVTRREKVVLSFILYIGIDSYSQEKATKVLGVAPDTVKRFIKQIIPLSLRKCGMSKSKKEGVRNYFLGLARDNTTLKV